MTSTKQAVNEKVVLGKKELDLDPSEGTEYGISKCHVCRFVAVQVTPKYLVSGTPVLLLPTERGHARRVPTIKTCESLEITTRNIIKPANDLVHIARLRSAGPTHDPREAPPDIDLDRPPQGSIAPNAMGQCAEEVPVPESR